MSMIMCMKIKEQHFPIISFAACVYLFTKFELTRFTTNEWYFLVGSSTKVADRFPVAPTLSRLRARHYPILRFAHVYEQQAHVCFYASIDAIF